MLHILDHIRRRIGPTPRRIPPERRRYLLTRAPFWVDQDDLIEFYRNQELLLREGTVVWGAFVQANGMTFGPGPIDHPATAIYTMDPAVDNDPERLCRIAGKLYGLRGGTWDDPVEQRYGDMLENERMRAMGWMAPAAQCEGLAVRNTTIMILRKHLPSRVLANRFFPLLVHPGTTAALIVPCDIWPPELAQTWHCDWPELDPDVWTANAITATPEGAAFVTKTFGPHAQGHPWFLRLHVDEPTDGFGAETQYALEWEMNADRHYLSESNGLRIIIAKSQLDLLAGLTLHHGGDAPVPKRSSTAFTERKR